MSTEYITQFSTVERTTTWTTNVAGEYETTSYGGVRNTEIAPATEMTTSSATTVASNKLEINVRDGGISFTLDILNTLDSDYLDLWPIGTTMHMLASGMQVGNMATEINGLQYFVFDAGSSTPARIRRDSKTGFTVMSTGSYSNSEWAPLLYACILEGGEYRRPAGLSFAVPVWGYSTGADETLENTYDGNVGLEWKFKTSKRTTSWTTTVAADYRSTAWVTERSTEIKAPSSRNTSASTLHVSAVATPVGGSPAGTQWIPVERATTYETHVYGAERTTASVINRNTLITPASMVSTSRQTVVSDPNYAVIKLRHGVTPFSLPDRTGTGDPYEDYKWPIGETRYLMNRAAPDSDPLTSVDLGDGITGLVFRMNDESSEPAALERVGLNSFRLIQGGKYRTYNDVPPTLMPCKRINVPASDDLWAYVLPSKSPDVTEPINVLGGLSIGDDEEKIAAYGDENLHLAYYHMSTEVSTSWETATDPTYRSTSWTSEWNTAASLSTSHVTEKTTEYLSVVAPVHTGGGGEVPGEPTLPTGDSLPYDTRWITERSKVTSATTHLSEADAVERLTSAGTQYVSFLSTGFQTYHQTSMVTSGLTEVSRLTQISTGVLTQRETDIYRTSGWFALTQKSTTKTTSWVEHFYRSKDGVISETSYTQSHITRYNTKRNTHKSTQVKVGSRTTDHTTTWSTGAQTQAFMATDKTTLYDTHYETRIVKEMSGTRTTEWSTEGVAGEAVETHWGTLYNELTSAKTVYTVNKPSVSQGTAASKVGSNLVTTEYLTGEDSVRYSTVYGTHEGAWETKSHSTRRSTHRFTNVLSTGTTAYNTTRSTEYDRLTRITGLGGPDTYQLTHVETDVISSVSRSTLKPRSQEVKHDTEWVTEYVSYRQTHFLTSHDTIVGDNLYLTSHLTQEELIEYGTEHLHAQVSQQQVPPLDVMGPFKLGGPFAQFSNHILKCISVEDMGLLARRGVDVYGEYYQPYGLSQHNYLSDFDAGAKLATLSSIDEQVELVVPTTYILSVPGDSYIAYSRLMLTVDLGLLPDALDLKVTEQEIANLLQRTLGRVPNVNVSRLPMDGGVTMEQHVLLERNRLREIKTVPSLQAQIDRLERRLQDELDRNSVLETALLEVTDEP